MLGVLCRLMSPQVRGEWRVCAACRLTQRPPFVLPRRPLVPIHEGQAGQAQCLWSATLPLMASRRRQRRAAAAPILAWPTSRRHHGLTRSSASVARPSIKHDGGRCCPSTAAAGRARIICPAAAGRVPQARFCCAPNCCWRPCPRMQKILDQHKYQHSFRKPVARPAVEVSEPWSRGVRSSRASRPESFLPRHPRNRESSMLETRRPISAARLAV